MKAHADAFMPGFYADLLTRQPNWSGLDPITRDYLTALAEHLDEHDDATAGALLTRAVARLGEPMSISFGKRHGG